MKIGFKVMLCSRRIFVFLHILITSACVYAESNDRGEFARAMEYYNSGEYGVARAIVDQYYERSDSGFALLSGLLYVKESKCSEALRVTRYVNNYYDANAAEVGKDVDTLNVYKYLKEINIYCYRKMEGWWDLEGEINALLKFVSNDNERIALLTNLGDVHARQVAAGMEGAVSVYESVIESEVIHGDNNIREAALFKVIGLYVYEDKKDKALRGAVQLIKNSPHAPHWIDRMQASKWHSWLLGQQEVFEIINKMKHQ